MGTALPQQQIDNFKLRLTALQKELNEKAAQQGKDAFQADLDSIATALERIAAGTFGACEQCGEPISMETLVVFPTTTRCSRCQ